MTEFRTADEVRLDYFRRGTGPGPSCMSGWPGEHLRHFGECVGTAGLSRDWGAGWIEPDEAEVITCARPYWMVT